ncbi:retrovirus-related pol polyprotein from transposon TNT 1-94 [Tanacetum coccineum]|uniref:Retrovirus-related pol polyprotein from transposon TNT 1-94 n=1 Tax=Tanacetum coccineum TaxID=301880 RepID=A0ABQ4YZQ4_9ASTR
MQPNEGICSVDKFEVIKYSIGDNKEFLAIRTHERDSWAQTVNEISSIYLDIFCKKDEGFYGTICEDEAKRRNSGAKMKTFEENSICYHKPKENLINDMNIYKMKMEQFQVNTKFLNSLPPEWSKFVTDVKLVKALYTSNFDQLHAYLKQHELHANEVRIMRERSQDPLAFVANQQMTPPHFNPYQSSYNNPQLQQQFSPSQYGSIQSNQQYSSHYPSQTQFNHSSIQPSHTFQSQINHQTSAVPQVIPQVANQSPQSPTQLMTETPFIDLGFAVPVFSPGDDPIACLNKAMDFLTAIASLRFPTTINQLRTSSNPRNQATIQDGRVTVEQSRVVKCYNCQGEGHMARQCTRPKRPRNVAWYKEKAMLAEAQEAGQILDEEQLAFLADPGIPACQAQTVIPHNAAFQTEDLDTYDSDCDDLSNA